MLGRLAARLRQSLTDDRTIAALMLPRMVLTHLKRGFFAAFAPPPVLTGGMGAACLGHAGKAAEPIGYGVNACLKRRVRKSGDRRSAEPFDAAKGDLIGFAVAGRGNGSYERRLACGAASTGSGAAAADIGVVHPHVALQALGRVALHHGLGEFVLEGPGGCLGDAKPPAEFEARDALLGLGEEIHGLEPEAQPQLARREDRSRPDRCLFAAGAALVQNPGAAFDDAVLAALAVRTPEPLGPAPPRQRSVAKRFGSVQTVELGFAHALLKLNFVARYVKPRCKSVCFYFLLNLNPR